MEGIVHGQVNDDGVVQFFFNKKHHLMPVLEGGPRSFKEWMVAVDRWSNRNSPSIYRISLSRFKFLIFRTNTGIYKRF